MKIFVHQVVFLCSMVLLALELNHKLLVGRMQDLFTQFVSQTVDDKSNAVGHECATYSLWDYNSSVSLLRLLLFCCLVVRNISTWSLCFQEVYTYTLPRLKHLSLWLITKIVQLTEIRHCILLLYIYRCIVLALEDILYTHYTCVLYNVHSIRTSRSWCKE